MKRIFASVWLLALLFCQAVPARAQDSQTAGRQNSVPQTAVAPVNVPQTIIVHVTEAADLRALADKAGYDGHSPARYAFVVPQGVNVLGKMGGGTAIDSGVWPDGVFVALVVEGNVYGGGGNGGDGGDMPLVRDGGRGGDAVYVRAPMTVLIMPGGSIKAGGGGASGAEGIGSGGGGGFPNGKGGEGGSARYGDGGYNMAGDRGHYGTPGGGGLGGQRGSLGGRGGDAGMAGLSLAHIGGGEGFAIRANGFSVILDNKGDIRGQAS